MKEAQILSILSTKGILMKLYPVIKVDQYAKRGDFKGRGAEKSPYSWCWLDLTRKKVQIVIKRLPAQY